MFPTIQVVSHVFFAIWEDENSLSVHFIGGPLALILTSVWPKVQTRPVDLVVFELAHKHVSFIDREASLSIFHAVLVEPLMNAGVGPRLSAEAMLLVIDPLTFIPGPIRLRVDAVTMCFVI